MDDVKVLLALLVVMSGIGLRMEVGPARVHPGKDPVQALVDRKVSKAKDHSGGGAAGAGGAGAGGAGAAGAAGVAAAGAGSAAAATGAPVALTEEERKKMRAAGGDIDQSTEKALDELEDHNQAVADRLKTLPFGGGGSDEEAEDEEDKKK